MASSDMNGLGRWVKRQGELVASIAALIGAAAAVIAFFGGSIPPWYTPAQAATDQAKTAKIQQQTVTTIGQISDQVKDMKQRLDLKDCAAYAATLGQADAALRKNPGDPIAQALHDSTSLQMRQVQGCQP